MTAADRPVSPVPATEPRECCGDGPDGYCHDCPVVSPAPAAEEECGARLPLNTHDLPASTCSQPKGHGGSHQDDDTEVAWASDDRPTPHLPAAEDDAVELAAIRDEGAALTEDPEFQRSLHIGGMEQDLARFVLDRMPVLIVRAEAAEAEVERLTNLLGQYDRAATIARDQADEARQQVTDLRAGVVAVAEVMEASPSGATLADHARALRAALAEGGQPGEVKHGPACNDGLPYQWGGVYVCGGECVPDRPAPVVPDITDQVRYAWCWYGGASRPESDERAAAFDAWLAAHDREVRAQALRDAADEFWDIQPNGTALNAHQVARRLRDRADAEERGER